VFFVQLIVHLRDGLFGVKNGCEIEGNSDVDVSGGGLVTADIFKEKFWFGKIKILRIQEFRVRNCRPRAHFEEAVDNEEECLEMTGNSSATFRTLSMVCWTALPTDFRVDLHLLSNSWRPSRRFRPKCRSR
jgi:hypothetical protein